MMFHWIKLRAFVYATEDRKKVIRAMENTGISGNMRRDMAEGAYGDTIEILELRGERKSEIDALFKSLSEGDIRELLDEVDERMDDEGVFHFRLGKQEMYEDKHVLSRGGDIISVEIKVATYPSSREKAIALMREYLEAML